MFQALPQSIAETQPTPAAQLPDVVTVEEAAALLRVGRKVISAMCITGELNAWDSGSGKHRIWRIPRDSILELMNRRSGGAP